MMNEGPFPALRGLRDADRGQPHAPKTQGTSNRPRGCSRATWKPSARQGFPYAATTYRLTEHFHYWTKHVESNAIIQPEQFVEIGEALAAERASGRRPVKVSSNRGYIKAVAVVTSHQPLGGRKTVHHVGIPLHWGFKGVAKNGFITNTLTPFVGDGTPDAGVQVLPGQRRESLRRPPWHCNH